MPYRARDIYRGRRKYRLPLTIGITVLAVLLVGGIALFYALQQFIVYDQAGVHLELPFGASARETVEEQPEETAPVLEAVPVEVVYEEPDFSDLDLGGWEGLAPTKAKFVPFDDASDEGKLNAALAKVGEEYNGVVLELKDRRGRLAWASESEMATAYDTGGAMDYTETVEALHEKGLTAAALISCFADELIATRNWPVTLQTENGPYKDKDGVCWLDPYNRSVRDYLAELMGELAAMGFDEIILADLYHPIREGYTAGESAGDGEESDGAEQTAASGTGFRYSVTLQTAESPVNAVCQAARRLAESMEDTEVTVSALLDQDSLLNGRGAQTGQDLGIFWRIFARLYCAAGGDWSAASVLEYAGETLTEGDAAVRFVPVSEFFPEDFQSYLILPTVAE